MYKVFSRLAALLKGADARSRWLPVLLIAMLPCLNLAVFTWGAGDTALTQDQWYFMPMVGDYFAGDFHAFSLWVTHSQHRTPGYKALFLLDAILFKLDLRVEIALGFAALTVGVLLLMRRFRDTLPPGASPPVIYLGLVTLAFTGFNLNQWYSASYALTALGGYGGILCFVSLWLMLDSRLRQGDGSSKTLTLCLTLAFTLLAFAAGMGPALVVSLLAVPVGVMLLERSYDKSALVLLAWLAFCATGCELIYWVSGGIHLTDPHARPFLDVAMERPGAVLEYLVLSYGASLIPAEALEKHFHGLGHDLDLLTGMAVIGLYLFCGFSYLRLRMWKASYVPAFLLVFSTLFILSTLVVRLPSAGLETSETPRYVLYSQLGLTGCLWILYQRFAGAGLAAWMSRLGPSGCFTAAAILYAFSLVALWSYYPAAVRNREAAVQQVLTGDFSRPGWVCLEPKLCDAGRATLIRYHLNVFASGPSQP